MTTTQTGYDSDVLHRHGDDGLLRGYQGIVYGADGHLVATTVTVLGTDQDTWDKAHKAGLRLARAYQIFAGCSPSS